MSEDAHPYTVAAPTDAALLDQMLARNHQTFARLLSVVAERHAIGTQLRLWGDISRSAHRIVAPTEPNGLQAVLDAVCDATAVTQEEVLGRSRRSHIALARQIAMILYREVSGASSGSVGARFGRDHGTVLYAEQKVRDFYDTCNETRRIIQAIRARLELPPWTRTPPPIP